MINKFSGIGAFMGIVVLSPTFIMFNGAASARGEDETARQHALTPDQTEPIVRSFLDMMAAGRTYDAFAAIKAISPAASSEMDTARDRTQRLVDRVRADQGKPIGYDLVNRRLLGTSLLRYECLLKLESFPLRCTILFYKPTDAWVPVQIEFDQNIQQMFEDLSK